MRYKNQTVKNKIKASLTVEAAMVLPVCLFFFVMFLYFIQIFIVQETLQQAMTDTGLGIARTAYIFSDFQDIAEAADFDVSIMEEETRMDLGETLRSVIEGGSIKYAVKNRLNTEGINNACIAGGFDGISFFDSQIFRDNDDIDIVAKYRVRIPVRLFGLFEKEMVQRVKLRGWYGYQFPALYSLEEEEAADKKEKMVYVAENGTVYHLDRNCSHIKLSVKAVDGIPTVQRNKNGGIYQPCDACINKDDSGTGTYFITSYGDRYHRDRNCSKIKRTVRQIPLSEAGHLAPCKRCGGG